MSDVRPIDPSLMRRLNAATTLRALHRGRETTLSGLTETTGLSRRTVELIMDDLLRAGVVEEQRPSAGPRTVGRPARTFAFNPRFTIAMSLYLAHDFVEVALCDLYGTPLGTWTEPTGARVSREERLASARSVVRTAFVGSGLAASRIGAVTIATLGIVHDDGVVDLHRGVGRRSPSLEDWHGFNLAERLDDEFECPVYVENDAKLAAVGEHWYGAAQGARNFVALLADRGRAGLGVVVDGELYRGHDGQAGEIVWAEQVLGLGKSLSDLPLSHLGDTHTAKGRRATEILAGARRGERAALDEVERLASAMMPGVLALLWVLAPQVFILGGTLGPAGDVLLPALRARLPEPLPDGVELRATTLGGRAVTLGALRNSLDRIEASLFAA